ncbi:MAG: hypothetical protein DLM63_07145 [Solirubrobacterales bacterium]|nr:MAG: hypothetical protein DLM63_07145 [Solirubrobacterales bacterium]
MPSEIEWERAATWDPLSGEPRTWPWGGEIPDHRRANVNQDSLGPEAVGGRPLSSSAYGCQGLIGDVWEWTSSPFAGYPGFVARPYREYSEVFFGGDYRVLRGGSWATAAQLATPTFRNWDHPQRRQIFAGLRLARSGL